MRVVYFSVAAVFTVAVLVMNWTGTGGVLVWVALAVAAVALVLGFVQQAAQRTPQPVELDDEKRETIARLKQEGNEAGAIRQVQLWFRDASPEEARRVVRDTR